MDGRPEQFAERRDGLVSIVPDGSNGVTKALLRTRLKHDRWRSVRRRVAAVNGTPPSWHQSVRAAVMSAGTGAFASHATALRLWGVDVPRNLDGEIHLSAPRMKQMRMVGVTSHRFTNLEGGDVVVRWEVPTASPIRLVIDLSSQLTDAQLGRIVDEFLRRANLRIDELRERVDRLRPAPGRSVARLRRVLAGRPTGYMAGDSEFETRVLRLLVRQGFPKPVSQHWVRRPGFAARLDHAYPDVKLYLESDGFGWHQFASDLDRDSQRRNELVGDGWRPLTLTWRMSDAVIVATMDRFYDRLTKTWKTAGALR